MALSKAFLLVAILLVAVSVIDASKVKKKPPPPPKKKKDSPSPPPPTPFPSPVASTVQNVSTGGTVFLYVEGVPLGSCTPANVAALTEFLSSVLGADTSSVSSTSPCYLVLSETNGFAIYIQSDFVDIPTGLKAISTLSVATVTSWLEGAGFSGPNLAVSVLGYAAENDSPVSPGSGATTTPDASAYFSCTGSVPLPSFLC